MTPHEPDSPARQRQQGFGAGGRIRMGMAFVVIVVGSLFVALGVVIPTTLMHDRETFINDLAVISPDSDYFPSWRSNNRKSSAPMFQNFYVWNLTNAPELLSGAATVPSYKQCGPYVYRRYFQRDGLIYTDFDNLVSYLERTWLSFDAGRSVGSLNDLTTNVNPYYFSNNQTGESLIVTTTVQQWIWGDGARAGFFLNDSAPGIPNTVYTGVGDLSMSNMFYKWKDMSSLCSVQACGSAGYWGKEITVTGTTGYQFAPAVDPETAPPPSRFVVWSSELLRPFNILTTPVVPSLKVQGLLVDRYRIDNATFAVDEAMFQPVAGFANMSQLYQGIPIFISRPNMLFADPAALNSVKGMNPQVQTSEIFFDVEPITGKTVQAFYRLQPNLYVTSQWSGIVNIPVNTFYPILWSEVATQVTKDMAFTMSENIYLPSRVRPYAFWLGVLGGSALVILSSCYMVYSYYNRHKHDAYDLIPDPEAVHSNPRLVSLSPVNRDHNA